MTAGRAASAALAVHFERAEAQSLSTLLGQSTGFETRVVAVGSEGSGKTALLRALAGEPFLSTYEPTVFGEFVRDAAQGRAAVLLCDTPGRDDLAHLRPRLYADADGFIVCFSLASRQSLQDVPRRVAELELLGGCVPWVLVATHGDLRGKPEQHVEESTAELCGIAKRLGALAFFELSSKLGGAEFDLALASLLGGAEASDSDADDDLGATAPTVDKRPVSPSAPTAVACCTIS
jgi:Rho family protein